MISTTKLFLPICAIFLSLNGVHAMPKAYYVLTADEPQFLNFVANESTLYETLLYDSAREFVADGPNNSKWINRIIILIPDVTENDVFLDVFAKLKLRQILPLIRSQMLNIQIVGCQRGISYEQAREDIDKFLVNTSLVKPHTNVVVPLGAFIDKEFTANGKKVKSLRGNVSIMYSVDRVIAKLKTTYFHLR